MGRPPGALTRNAGLSRRAVASGRGAVLLVEPGYERCQLVGDAAGFVDGVPHVVGIGCRATTVAGDLASDEPAQRDADRCCAEAGAVGGPGLIAHLHSRHAITGSSSTFLCPVFTLSSSTTHVYVVDDAADALEE